MRQYGITATALLVVLGGCGTEPTAPLSATADVGAQATAQSVSGVSGSATGSAHITVFPAAPQGLGLRNFTFSAVEHSNGSTTGEWQIVVGGTILHGPIDCLTIAPDGASARISGLVTSVKFSPTFVEGSAFAMELFENGPGAAADPDGTTSLRAFRNLDPSVGRDFCETGAVPTGTDLDPLPTEHGNLTIRLRG